MKVEYIEKTKEEIIEAKKATDGVWETADGHPEALFLIIGNQVVYARNTNGTDIVINNKSDVHRLVKKSKKSISFSN